MQNDTEGANPFLILTGCLGTLLLLRNHLDVIGDANCHTQERSEADFFCPVLKRNDVIQFSITEQSITSYVFNCYTGCFKKVYKVNQA